MAKKGATKNGAKKPAAAASTTVDCGFDPSFAQMLKDKGIPITEGQGIKLTVVKNK